MPAAVEEKVKGLGQRVRLARIRRKLSIVNLAAKAGIDRKTLGAGGVRQAPGKFKFIG